MLTLDSTMNMNGLDLAVSDEILVIRTSRTATFTLSSSPLSRPPSEENLHQESIPFGGNRQLKHSQSMIIDRQRRRPIIEDPYQLAPNLQILNDWMITTTGKSRRELSEAHGLTEEQIAIFEESFSLLDINGDGNITEDELHSLMKALGYNPSEEYISSVISKIDIDGNGSVDFDEFLIMMRNRLTNGEINTELQRVFNVFDKNHDGFIDRHELSDMLSRLGECLTEDEVMDMIKEADCLDHDGKVSFEEFQTILHLK